MVKEGLSLWKILKAKVRKLGRSGGYTRQRIYEFLCMLNRVRKHGSYYERSIFCIPEKKVLYVSVPKAGNTSIKASMYALPVKEDYRAVHSEIRKISEHSRWSKIGDYPDYFKFTFVRNPFERLVSCYENKLHSDVAGLGKTLSMLIYDRYLLGFLGKDRGFISFARRICLIPDRLADKHFMSQSFSLVDKNGNVLLNYVGRLENMNADYETIRQKFNFKPLPHYNKTKKEKRNWMDYYDLDTARRVYRRYKTDIEVFGYQDTYEKLVAYLKAKEKAA